MSNTIKSLIINHSYNYRRIAKCGRSQKIYRDILFREQMNSKQNISINQLFRRGRITPLLKNIKLKLC